MNYDWNWFFSSFCQCAAALIGIIGAFVISRLLGLSEKVNSTISEFDNLVIEYSKLKESISKRYFNWYTETVVAHSNKLRESISRGNFEGFSEEAILVNVYKEHKNIFKIDSAVLKSFYSLYDDFNPNKPKDFGFQNFIITTNELFGQLQGEKDKIYKLEIESKSLIQYFNQNKQVLQSYNDSINPLKSVIILLIVAFPLTVIYPLHFMPMIANGDPILTYNPILILKTFLTLKSLMLIIFLFAINGIFGYFLYLTSQLKSKLSKAIADNSDDYKNIKNYSVHFENE